MSRKLLLSSASVVLMGSASFADAPSVAVDIAPVHSLVAQVMEGVGTPDLITPPEASPHEYNMRPSEAEALQNADLVFWMGEDLAPWLEDAIETLAENADVTTLLEAEETFLLDFREDALFEAHDHDAHGDDDHEEHEDHADDAHDDHDHEEHAEAGHDDHDHDHEEHAEAGHDDHDHDHEEHAEAGHDDHDHDHEEHAEKNHDAHDEHDHEEHAEADHDEHGHEGHAHGEHDPHAWLSADNAAAWLNLIAARLSAADPDNAGAYFANAAAARDDLLGLTEEINGMLDSVRGGKFVVFHDAYHYFEDMFDFPASGAISLSDATDPSPARIAEIQSRVKDEAIACVLSEPQFNSGLVATVMDGTEANTAVLDPIGAGLEPGPDLYPQLLENLASSLLECLS